MKPCSRNTFLVTGALLAMFLLHPAGQEASAATQGTNPDKICKYKKKCSSCSSGDCSSDSSAEQETKEIRISQNKECPSDPTEVGLTDEYEFAGSEPVPPTKGRRSADEPPVKMAGGFSANYVHPKNLKLYGDGGEIVRDADTNIRQIKGDSGFMDVIFTPESKTLELRLYKPESIEQKKLNGVYPIKAGEKALTIIRYVQEADGRVRTETVDNTAEFPSVKSERVTQEVGTEPYTLIQTKTYLKGEGSSAIEYKRVSKKITAVLNGAPKEEKYQYTQEEMGSDGQWHLTERKAGRRAIYKEEDGFVTLYECNAVNEDGTPMNPIATETTYTYYNDPLQVASHGKIKTLRRNDGYWENKYYDNNANAGLETEKTESPWLDTAAHEPGTAPSGAIRIKTEISCSTDTGTEDITETVNGILIAKEWTEKTPFDHQKVKEVRHQPHSGGDKITTTIRYRKAKDIPTHLTGKPVSIHNADGSMSLYSYELQDQNLIVTEDEGYGEGNVVNHGIRTVSIQDKSNGKLKEEVRYALEGGQSYWLSSKTGVTFDGKGTCLKWVYNNDPDDYTEQRKDCCQVTWERGRDGIETNYTYDVAGKQTSSTARGITYTTEYKGLTTINWKQATGSNNRFLVDQITKNEAGQIIEKKKPVVGNKTLVTTQSYNIPERKLITITPTQTKSEIINFSDGKIKSFMGTTGITQTFTYAPSTQGGGGVSASATDGNRNLVATMDLLNNTVSEQNDNISFTYYVYDSSARKVRITQPDGETQIFVYKDDVTIIGIDLNGDGILNSANDRMSKNERVFDSSWPEGKGSWKTMIANAWQGSWIFSSITWKTEDGSQMRKKMLGVAGYIIQQKAGIAQSGINHTDIVTSPDGQIQETSYTMIDGQATAKRITQKDTTGGIILSENRTFDMWENALTRTENRTGTTTYSYDEGTGTLLSKTEPNQTTMSYKYNDFGQGVTTILSDGSEQHTKYDLEGRIIRQWGSQRYPVSYEYDDYGRMIGMTTYRVPVGETALWPENADGDKTIWLYDTVNGNLLQKIYPNGNGSIYTYTQGGKLKTEMNGRGNVCTYSYNEAGQVVAIYVNDNGVTPEKKYTYDQLGRMSSAITEGIVAYHYTYNDQNKIMKEQVIVPTLNGNLERSFVRSYDSYGRSIGYQFRNGEHVEQNIEYAYNSTGLLDKITSDGKQFSYTYVSNAPHLVSQMTSVVHTVDKTYDENRDILRSTSNIWKNKRNSSIVSKYNYMVNDLGQRITLSIEGETFGGGLVDWTWTYDSLGQIVSGNEEYYSYDQIGNRQNSQKGNEPKTSYIANELNQYAKVGNVMPMYDADGNQISGLKPTSALPNRDKLTFLYDAENRPIRVFQNEEILEEYTYDHIGRRIKKGNSIILYDGYNAVAEYNINTHAIKATYAWGNDLSGKAQGSGGIGGLIAVTEYDRQIPLTSYPCYDGNGNITEYLTEGNGGTLTAHYEYDAFGQVISKTGERDYCYQFSSKPYDVITGLNYYNYRNYDSVSARWISRDPLLEVGGSNLYSYSMNDSINFIDYLGMKKCSVKSLKINNAFDKDKGEIDDNGTIKAKKPFESLPKKHAAFEVDIEFDKPDCKCCEMRQHLEWSKDFDMNHSKLPKKTDKPIEDVDAEGRHYGHRSDPPLPGFDSYYHINPDTGKRVPDQDGDHYYSNDNPKGKNKGTMTFTISVIDTCNENKVVKSKKLTVDFND